MADRAYDELRTIVERRGGTMTFTRSGHRYGAWIISIDEKTATIEATGKSSFPQLDSLYQTTHPNPLQWHDYDGPLTAGAEDRLLSLLQKHQSGWSAEDFAQFVHTHRWQFAKTMPDNPHEYTLRKETSNETFESAVGYVREHGCEEYYGGRAYTTLYFADHKYWTMGADLNETILINRKPHVADASHSLTNGLPEEPPQKLELSVEWDGPFSPEEVVATFYDARTPPPHECYNYGLYQIYGTHLLTGPSTLLYIGRTTEQSFATRIGQHLASWLGAEREVQVYLGRIYDPSRHSPRDDWATWTSDVCMAECLLIYKYTPPYNSTSIACPPSLGVFRSAVVNHRGKPHHLHPRDSAPDDW